MLDLPVMFIAWREKLNDTSTNTLVKKIKGKNVPDIISAHTKCNFVASEL